MKPTLCLEPIELVLCLCVAFSAGARPAPAAEPPPAAPPSTNLAVPVLVGSLGRKEALTLEGNHSFTAAQIIPALRQQIDFLLAAHPAAPLADYLFAIENLVRAGYLRNGFPEAQALASVDTRAGRLLVKINEGPRYKTGKVRFQGVAAIADKAIQKRLIDAIAGLPTPATGTANINQLTVLWEKDGYAPFDEGATRELNDRLTAELTDLNYYHPKLKVTVVPDSATGKADLLIEMLDEGLKGTIEEFALHYPTREKKNTDQEVLAFLGLKPGLAVRASLLNDLTNRLWLSGRFLRHEANLTPLAQVGQFQLDLALEDLEAAPPLRQPLSTNELIFLKLGAWLTDLEKHPEDLVFSCDTTLPGLGPLNGELVLSKSGLVLITRTAASNGPPRFAYGVVFSGKSVGCYSAWRQRKLVTPGGHTVQAFIALVPNPNSTGPSRFNLTLGAGFSSAEPDRPIDWTLTFAPAKFLDMAHQEKTAFSLREGVLATSCKSGSEFPYELKIDAATGRLLEWSGDFRTNDMRFLVQIRSEKGGYARRVSEIARATAGFTNEFRPAHPFSSWVAFVLSDLFESRLLESSFVSNLVASSSSSSKALALAQDSRQIRRGLDELKAALGKKELVECFMPLEAKLTNLLNPPGGPEESKETFSLPPKDLADKSQMERVLAFLGAWLVDKSDAIWPRETWPWTLTREAGFTLAGSGKYTPGELQKLLVSNQTGPLGSWAAAALLARLNAPLSEKFTRRALDQLSIDRFQADLAVLLAPENVVGQVLGDALSFFARMKDSDLDALAALVGLQNTALLRDTAQRLRAATNQPPAQVLRPVIERNWDAIIRPRIEAELSALLAKVGTPTTAQGAFERASFILQSAPKPEDLQEAQKLYFFAAEKGYGPAQLRVAWMYDQGQGVPQDYAEAMKWLLKAAAQNEPHAACRVADFYFEGLGVARDLGTARKWYEREATNGCERSQFRLGQCLELQSNLAGALPWFRRAATNGLTQAQSALGERLSEGLATPPDYAEAYLWYRVAAGRGDRLAAVSARRVKTKLNPTQLPPLEQEADRLIEIQNRHSSR